MFLRMGNTTTSRLSTLYLPSRRGVRTNYAESKVVNTANVTNTFTATHARIFSSTANNSSMMFYRAAKTQNNEKPINVIQPNLHRKSRVRPMKSTAISFGVPKVANQPFQPPSNPAFQFDATEVVEGKNKTISKVNKRSIVRSKTWAHIDKPEADSLTKEIKIEKPNIIVYGEFTLREKPYNTIITNYRGDAEFEAVSKSGRWSVTKARNIGFSNR